MGRRVRKKVYEYKGLEWKLKETRLFLWDGWNMIEEIVQVVAEEEYSKYYVWGLDLSQSLDGAGGVGGLLAACDILTSTTYYFHYDIQGNVTQILTFLTCVLAAAYNYDEFGKIVFSYEEYAENNQNSFSTKYYDIEIGFIYYGYRYYYPELGRWCTKDPIGYNDNIVLFNQLQDRKIVNNIINSFDISLIDEYNAIKINMLYCFIDNNPINFLDLFGLSKADVKKISNIFRKVVDKMTTDGDRHPIPYLNNILRTLHIVSKGKAGIPYLSCGEQEERVTLELKREVYENSWIFQYNHYYIHIWGEAISDNICDPKIIYDPWKNKIKFSEL